MSETTVPLATKLWATGPERLLAVVATCPWQGRRLLDSLVEAIEAALQGTAAPALLLTQLG